MGTITATFRTKDDALAAHNGERVTVAGEQINDDGELLIRVTFPDDTTDDAFNDELTDWRLEA